MLNLSPRAKTIRWSRTLAALMTVAGIFVTGMGQAGASTGCGEYSFGFAGTRLLNDGISTSAGPFPISLPAGTYDVTLQSFDDHVGHPGQHDQTFEQFYAVLDSGWISAPSDDIADAETQATTVHSGQVIGDSTAISVHHVGLGNVNSVDVVCVGFTPTIPAEVADDVEEPAIDEADPAPIDPLSLQRPADNPKPSSVPRESDPIDPLSLERPVDTAGIEPDVQGQIETVPVLALTGPGDATTIALLGVTLVALGMTFVAADRRLQAIQG